MSTIDVFLKHLLEAHHKRPLNKIICFNDMLNTFYFQLYGVEQMVYDHLDNMRGNSLLPLHGLLVSIGNKRSFICIILTDRKVHTAVFVSEVVEH